VKKIDFWDPGVTKRAYSTVTPRIPTTGFQRASLRTEKGARRGEKGRHRRQLVGTHQHITWAYSQGEIPENVTFFSFYGQDTQEWGHQKRLAVVLPRTLCSVPHCHWRDDVTGERTVISAVFYCITVRFIVLYYGTCTGL